MQVVPPGLQACGYQHNVLGCSDVQVRTGKETGPDRGTSRATTMYAQYKAESYRPIGPGWPDGTATRTAAPRIVRPCRCTCPPQQKLLEPVLNAAVDDLNLGTVFLPPLTLHLALFVLFGLLFPHPAQVCHFS